MMPKIVEEKYRDILKVEFKDMLDKFLGDRTQFHAYSIGRACTQGTLLGFDYHYYTIEGSPELIGKYIDLEGYGEIHFHINTITNYGKLASDNNKAVIRNFLDNYSLESRLSLPLP